MNMLKGGILGVFYYSKIVDVMVLNDMMDITRRGQTTRMALRVYIAMNV